MSVVLVHRADPIRAEHPIEPITIQIELNQTLETADADWQEKARALYRSDAKTIADALWKALPGGTLDELVVEMLTRRASLLRVPQFPPRAVSS